MDNRRFGDRGTVRLMLWAAALLFILNFYMFVAARPSHTVIERASEPVAESTATAPRCFVTARVEATTSEVDRMREVRRVLAIERERLRSRTVQFVKPELRVTVSSSSG